jgi:hypothetical protein
MNRFSRIAGLLPLVILANFPALLRSQVKITRNEPVIERRTFDPRRPPATMPKLRPGEAAITYTNFGADIQIGGEVTKASPAPEGIEAQVKIGMIEMTLRMNATIWLPTNGNAKIEKHEEGHRQIAEHYYADAEPIARAFAEPLIGTTVVGRGKDSTDAANNALAKARSELASRYMSATDGAGGKAQQIYEQLTAHGTNAMNEQKAINDAIARVSREMPSTRATSQGR